MDEMQDDPDIIRGEELKERWDSSAWPFIRWLQDMESRGRISAETGRPTSNGAPAPHLSQYTLTSLGEHYDISRNSLGRQLIVGKAVPEGEERGIAYSVWYEAIKKCGGDGRKAARFLDAMRARGEKVTKKSVRDAFAKKKKQAQETAERLARENEKMGGPLTKEQREDYAIDSELRAIDREALSDEERERREELGLPFTRWSREDLIWKRFCERLHEIKRDYGLALWMLIGTHPDDSLEDEDITEERREKALEILAKCSEEHDKIKSYLTTGVDDEELHRWLKEGNQ